MRSYIRLRFCLFPFHGVRVPRIVSTDKRLLFGRFDMPIVISLTGAVTASDIASTNLPPFAEHGNLMLAWAVCYNLLGTLTRLCTPWVKKNMSPYFCPYLRQILTDFKNFFTVTLCGKVAIKRLLIISPHLNCVATLPCETVMQVNLTKLQSVRAHSDFSGTSEISDQHRSRWSVWHWIVLDLSLWIADVLNAVFLAGLPGLVPVYQHWWVVSFSSVHACFGLPLPCLLLVSSVSLIFFSKLLNALLFHFISANSVSILHKPHSLYWCKFLINVLPWSINGMLRYWYFFII